MKPKNVQHLIHIPSKEVLPIPQRRFLLNNWHPANREVDECERGGSQTPRRITLCRDHKMNGRSETGMRIQDNASSGRPPSGFHGQAKLVSFRKRGNLTWHEFFHRSRLEKKRLFLSSVRSSNAKEMLQKRASFPDLYIQNCLLLFTNLLQTAIWAPANPQTPTSKASQAVADTIFGWLGLLSQWGCNWVGEPFTTAMETWKTFAAVWGLTEGRPWTSTGERPTGSACGMAAVVERKKGCAGSPEGYDSSPPPGSLMWPLGGRGGCGKSTN